MVLTICRSYNSHAWRYRIIELRGKSPPLLSLGATPASMPCGERGKSVYKAESGTVRQTREMPRTSVARQLAAIALLVGAVLLFTALWTPWYSLKEFSSGGNLICSGGGENTTYYLGAPWSNGTVQTTTYPHGGPTCGPTVSSQTSYAGAHFNSTGEVVGITYVLLLVGGALAAVGGALGVISRGRERWITPVLVSAVLAVALAAVAPGFFSLALPWAFTNDMSSAARGGLNGGPWSSFSGSSATHVPGGPIISLSWGPLEGYYLSILGLVVLLVAAIALFLYRREPPEPVPVPSPEITPAAA